MTDDRDEGVLVQVMAFDGQDSIVLVRLLQRLLQVSDQVGEDLAIRVRNVNVRV